MKILPVAFLSLLAVLFLPFAVLAQVNLNSGLVAKFDLNGNTLDSSGNGHNAPVSGLHSYVTDRFGAAGSAFLIDVPGALAEGDGIALSGSSLSLSFWYLKYSDPIDRAIIRVGTVSSAGEQLHVQIDYPNSSPADLRFTFFSNDLDLFTAPPQSINQWYHAVLTYDEPSHVRQIWMDGSLVASDAAAFGFSGNDHFDFGSPNLALDDLVFYNRVLTPDEVAALNTIPEPSSIALAFLLGGVVLFCRRPS